MSNTFPEPCYACDEPAIAACSDCGDACCEDHSVIVEGIVFCDYCHEESQNKQEEEE